eukprot:TRINITY_DN5655_c0_g1_i1.p1 TRINITY_DN5655_c0_g1~~TRINITY_DN5655_c0_g1_i1.p1  ORF type:complete len:1890 (-),score=285.46 TRINITY_DN5655_c0_g1_i1:712-5883(-)
MALPTAMTESITRAGLLQAQPHPQPQATPDARMMAPHQDLQLQWQQAPGLQSLQEDLKPGPDTLPHHEVRRPCLQARQETFIRASSSSSSSSSAAAATSRSSSLGDEISHPQPPAQLDLRELGQLVPSEQTHHVAHPLEKRPHKPPSPRLQPEPGEHPDFESRPHALPNQQGNKTPGPFAESWPDAQPLVHLRSQAALDVHPDDNLESQPDPRWQQLAEAGLQPQELAQPAPHRPDRPSEQQREPVIQLLQEGQTQSNIRSQLIPTLATDVEPHLQAEQKVEAQPCSQQQPRLDGGQEASLPRVPGEKPNLESQSRQQLEPRLSHGSHLQKQAPRQQSDANEQFNKPRPESKLPLVAAGPRGMDVQRDSETLKYTLPHGLSDQEPPGNVQAHLGVLGGVHRLSHVRRTSKQTDSCQLKELAEVERASLVQEMFSALDLDQNGFLSESEIWRMAAEMGFEGNSAEWSQEYSRLCADRTIDDSLGFDSIAFENLLNDTSDSGCYCTNEALYEALRILGNDQETSNTADLQHRSSERNRRAEIRLENHEGGDNMGEKRARLIEAIFLVLDLDRNGFLAEHEVWCMADKMGFSGSRAEWAEEYQQLCTDNRVDGRLGFDLIGFKKLLNDTSDSGCYCSDEALCDALQVLGHRSEPSNTIPDQHRRIPGHHTNAEDHDLGADRAKLIETIFLILDLDRNGFLAAMEIWRMADKMGFKGSEADWAQEYQQLCADNGVDGSQGFDLIEFSKLLNDTSDSGCHCADEALREALELLGREVAAQEIHESAITPPPNEAVEQPTWTRESGHMWEVMEESRLLPATRGIIKSLYTQAAFADQLTSPVGRQLVQSPVQRKHSHLSIVPKLTATQQQNVPVTMEESLHCQSQVSAATGCDRQMLLQSVFQAFDGDGDGKLTTLEMFEFARCAGFNGTNEQWDAKIALLCDAHGTDHRRGLSRDLLYCLVEDHSDGGFYCSDGKLQEILSIIGQGKVNMCWGDRPSKQDAVVDAHISATVEHEPSAATGCEPQSRLQDVLHTFDKNGDGKLEENEMPEIARLAGFTGSHGEWDAGFAMLRDAHCSEPRSGLSQEPFFPFVDDASDESRKMQAIAVQGQRDIHAAGMVGKQDSSADAHISGEVVDEPSASMGCDRHSLLYDIFRTFDIDGDGKLTNLEMLEFARLAGFNGNLEKWDAELQLLCDAHGADHRRGISRQLFHCLVDDASDTGLYCSGRELQAILSAVQQGQADIRSGEVGQPDLVGDAIVVGVVEGEASATTGCDRHSLIRDVFHAFDKDEDGNLAKLEMLEFARLAGFKGSNEEWNVEFAILCESHGAEYQKGISQELFYRLVNDASDSGLYCSDSELQKLVLSAGQGQVDMCGGDEDDQRDNAADADDGGAARDERSTAIGCDRHSLLRDIFQTFDLDGDGNLTELEMLKFVRLAGFRRTESQWNAEFKHLCEDNGADVSRGVSRDVFDRLIDGRGECALYCSSDKLRAMLGRESQPEHALPHKLDGGRPRSEPSDTISLIPRSDLKNAIFESLDADRDGFLNAAELFMFASASGFDDDENRWKKEYELLCKDQGVDPSVGLSKDLFMKLLDETGDAGLYCTDDELRAMVELDSESGESATSDLAEEAGRTDITNALFEILDLDQDGLLNESELRAFVDIGRTECEDEEWADEYQRVCLTHSVSSIDMLHFRQLVCDETQTFFARTTKELLSILLSMAGTESPKGELK